MRRLRELVHQLHLQRTGSWENAVDQLVEIIIIKVLSTPARVEIRCTNPSYTDFRFPQIKAHPWHKVFHNRMHLEAIDLASRLLHHSPSLHWTANSGQKSNMDVTARHPKMRVPKVGDLLSWGKRRNHNLSTLDSALVSAAMSSLNKFANDGSFISKFVTQKNDNTVDLSNSAYIKSEERSKLKSVGHESEETKEDDSIVKPNMSSNQLTAEALQLRMKGKHEEAEKLLSLSSIMRMKRLDYLLGDNPFKTSLMVGYGARYQQGIISPFHSVQVTRTLSTMSRDRKMAMLNKGVSRLKNGKLNIDPQRVKELLDDCVEDDDRHGYILFAYMIKVRLVENISCMTAYIDMLGRFGHGKPMRELFDGMKERHSKTWNVVLNHLFKMGRHDDGFKLFEEMRLSGATLTKHTFGIVLSAFAYQTEFEGMIDVFHMMETYGIKPNVIHYGAILNVLCKHREVRRAYDYIQMMPEVDHVMWRMLLSTCTVLYDFDMGEIAISNLRKLGSLSRSDHYVIAAHYQTRGDHMLADAEFIESRKKGHDKYISGSWSARHG